MAANRSSGFRKLLSRLVDKGSAKSFEICVSGRPVKTAATDRGDIGQPGSAHDYPGPCITRIGRHASVR
jgi:hypothetical protein